MPPWYRGNNYRIYLYSREQNHGYCISHFHVYFSDGRSAEYKYDGKILSGENDKEIQNLIKQNQEDIKNCLEDIASGKEIVPLNKRINKYKKEK